jgi:hypothetical protein
MNAPTSVTAVERQTQVSLAVPSESRHSVEKGSASQHTKVPLHIETEAERMRSMLLRLTSNSLEELEDLAAELQEVREFLKSEGERVQREVANYAQLNQSALAAIKIITETIGPWKSTALESEPQNSGTEPLPGEREGGKRVPSPGASK